MPMFVRRGVRSGLCDSGMPTVAALVDSADENFPNVGLLFNKPKSCTVLYMLSCVLSTLKLNEYVMLCTSMADCRHIGLSDITSLRRYTLSNQRL